MPIKKSEKYKEDTKTRMYPPSPVLPILFPVLVSSPDIAAVKNVGVCLVHFVGLPRWHSGKESACQCRRHEMQVSSLGWEDPLKEGMAVHSNIFA